MHAIYTESINMKRYFSAFCSLILFLVNVHAFGQEDQPNSTGQEQTKPISYGQEGPQSEHPILDRMFFGGSLGLQFGSATYIDVSPLVGYKITEKLHAGVGATYIYYKVKDTYYNYSYETSIYGGRIFGRYYFLDNLFGHLEWEILNMDVPSTNTINGVQSYDYIRDNIMSLMVGGGYAQPIGSNAAITLMILWNLTEEQYSPYQNPIFRLGIAAGF